MAQVALRTRLTYKDYCLIPNDGRRHEILGGRHHMTPAPETPHQHVSKRVFVILLRFFEEGGRGRVFYAPIDVILSDEDIVQPDLVVVTILTQIVRRGIEGPPTVIIEILSPSTAQYDRALKAERYAFFGVPHYWLVDPEARTFECYALENGQYILRVSGRDRDTVTPPDFAGLTIPLSEIWPH